MTVMSEGARMRVESGGKGVGKRWWAAAAMRSSVNGSKAAASPRPKCGDDATHLCAAWTLIKAVHVGFKPFLGGESADASGEASIGVSSTATVCAWSLFERDSTACIMPRMFATTCALPPARSEASPMAPQEVMSSWGTEPVPGKRSNVTHTCVSKKMCNRYSGGNVFMASDRVDEQWAR